MSSSQGSNAATLTASSGSDNYTYTNEYNRDASDWIRQKREQRKYTNYNQNSTDNKNTEPVWLKYGNQFRLTYSFGRLKCDGGCSGNAFSGKVGDVSPP
jgi:hypothetical protein